MKILLHICCGPCAVYPVPYLQKEGHQVLGFFYNPNVHPYQEFQKRLQAVKQYEDMAGLKVIYRESYDLEEFLRNVVFREQDRCLICYTIRLRATAEMAKSGNYEAFSTTLLYSKFQQHQVIRELGESIARDVQLAFHYEDFRQGWKDGIALSRQMDLYRQQYCGCIYSEKERYSPKGETW